MKIDNCEGLFLGISIKVTLVFMTRIVNEWPQVWMELVADVLNKELIGQMDRRN